MRRVCNGCKKEYWPNQGWLHEACRKSVDARNKEVVSDMVSPEVRRSGPPKQRWSREAYNAYQRDYMRKRRGADEV